MSEVMQALFNSPYFTEDTMSSVTDAIHKAHAEKGIGGGGDMFDARRFALTIEYIRKFGLHSGLCVEIGSLKYLSSQVIWGHFEGTNLVGTRHDLRHSPMPFPDGYVDNIVCTEVLEHISDVSYSQATTLSGLFYFLQEVKRVLKPGGKMLITTPNASSLWSMQCALMGRPPMMYEWHFREFTVDEMRQIIGDVGGLKIVEHRCEFAWHLWDFSYLTDFIESTSFSMGNRGDDQFLVVERDDSILPIPNQLNLPSKKQLIPTRKRRWSIGRQMAMNKLRFSLSERSTINQMRSY